MQIPVFQSSADLSLLSAMITPAVLISACGTLIFSTSTRLARIVDRVRALSEQIENEIAEGVVDFPEERHAEFERQLDIHARRGQLVQSSLTSFYISLGLFVAATVSIGIVALTRHLAWLPTALGIGGTVVMFYGSMLLIAETRLALHSVSSEMDFFLRLRDLRVERKKTGIDKTGDAKTTALQRMTRRMRNSERQAEK